MNNLQRKSLALLAPPLLLTLAGAWAASRTSFRRASVHGVQFEKPAASQSVPAKSSPTAPTSSGVGISIDQSVIASGGGSSSGTLSGHTVNVAGTIGQGSAGTTSSGGSFTVNGGFWQVEATPTSPTPTPPPNVAQFSSSNYTVPEGCTTVTITVNRVGDTSGAASVDYNTSDVTATERMDYITALGRLQFAPGETSKSFAVLINEDSYIEGNETFNVNLSNPLGMTLGAPAVAIVTIVDGASGPATNVIDNPQTFVCQHYHDFLNRQPDASGLAFWTNEIASCGNDPSCIEIKRLNVSAAFFLSIEFQNTDYLVERMYKTAFGDATGTSTFPSAHQLAVPSVRFREFLRDGQRIGDGVVVLQPDWEQKLEQNKQAFALEFVQRATFTSALPMTMTPAQFVNQLNQNAGNVLSAGEQQTAINLFGSALDSSNLTARAQALRLVAEDSDLQRAEFNRAFVLMEFFGYLRRNPNDSQDTDYSGYEFWLNKLNQFNGNYDAAEMVKAFIVSTEYRSRFGPP